MTKYDVSAYEVITSWPCDEGPEGECESNGGEEVLCTKDGDYFTYTCDWGLVGQCSRTPPSFRGDLSFSQMRDILEAEGYQVHRQRGTKG